MVSIPNPPNPPNPPNVPNPPNKPNFPNPPSESHETVKQPTVSATAENPPARATTTSEEDLHTLGQRRVNLIWETTQAIIAIGVTGAVIFAALRGIDSPILGNAFILITSIYYVRLNHTNVGGVGGTADRAQQDHR